MNTHERIYVDQYIYHDYFISGKNFLGGKARDVVNGRINYCHSKLVNPDGCFRDVCRYANNNPLPIPSILFTIYSVYIVRLYTFISNMQPTAKQ